MNIYGVWPSLKVARNADGPTLAESGFNLEIASWVRVNSSTWPQLHLLFLSCTRYRSNMTVYIYYNPTTPPSGQPGKQPLNERKHNFAILQGKLRLRKAYGEWWMITMVWLASNGMATCCDEPFTMSSSLINMLPCYLLSYPMQIILKTVRWLGKTSNLN